MKRGKCKFMKIMAIVIAVVLAVSSLPQGSLVSVKAADGGKVSRAPYDSDFMYYSGENDGVATGNNTLLATINDRTFNKCEKLSSKNIGKKVFAGISDKVVFEIPEKKAKSYLKLFIKAGAPVKEEKKTNKKK